MTLLDPNQQVYKNQAIHAEMKFIFKIWKGGGQVPLLKPQVAYICVGYQF